VVLAVLLADDPAADWAQSVLSGSRLNAPHLMPAEVTNRLRRAVAHGEISPSAGGDAVDDLLDLPIDLHPFEPLAGRVWELRGAVTAYDAWYVALAEVLDCPLATLDARLSRAAGPRCTFVLPSGA
jgi:predicted nucleic acid-binding protein